MLKNVFRVKTEMDDKLPLFLTSAGGWDNQGPMERKEGFPDFQWIQTLEGAGELLVNGTLHPVSKGQGMLLYPGEYHAYRAVREPWEVQWITFNGDHAEHMLQTLGFRESQVLYISNPDRTLKTIHAALSVLQSDDPLRAVACSVHVYQIVLDLFQYASRSEVKSKQQHFEQLAPAFAYIEQHYQSVITLACLAGTLGVSVQHTCLLFREALGMRPFAYITGFRLRKAKELLLNRIDMDVKDVAQCVGYEDASYFIKLFKQQEGVTPSRFRLIHRKL